MEEEVTGNARPLCRRTPGTVRPARGTLKTARYVNITYRAISVGRLPARKIPRFSFYLFRGCLKISNDSS